MKRSKFLRFFAGLILFTLLTPVSSGSEGPALVLEAPEEALGEGPSIFAISAVSRDLRVRLLNFQAGATQTEIQVVASDNVSVSPPKASAHVAGYSSRTFSFEVSLKEASRDSWVEFRSPDLAEVVNVRVVPVYPVTLASSRGLFLSATDRPLELSFDLSNFADDDLSGCRVEVQSPAGEVWASGFVENLPARASRSVALSPPIPPDAFGVVQSVGSIAKTEHTVTPQISCAGGPVMGEAPLVRFARLQTGRIFTAQLEKVTMGFVSGVGMGVVTLNRPSLQGGEGTATLRVVNFLPKTLHNARIDVLTQPWPPVQLPHATSRERYYVDLDPGEQRDLTVSVPETVTGYRILTADLESFGLGGIHTEVLPAWPTDLPALSLNTDGDADLGKPIVVTVTSQPVEQSGTIRLGASPIGPMGITGFALSNPLMDADNLVTVEPLTERPLDATFRVTFRVSGDFVVSTYYETPDGVVLPARPALDSEGRPFQVVHVHATTHYSNLPLLGIGGLVAALVLVHAGWIGWLRARSHAGGLPRMP